MLETECGASYTQKLRQIYKQLVETPRIIFMTRDRTESDNVLAHDPAAQTGDTGSKTADTPHNSQHTSTETEDESGLLLATTGDPLKGTNMSELLCLHTDLCRDTDLLIVPRSLPLSTLFRETYKRRRFALCPSLVWTVYTCVCAHRYRCSNCVSGSQ